MHAQRRGAIPATAEERRSASDDALVEAVERLMRVGVAVTTRALSDEPGVELTVQQWRVLVLVAESSGRRVGEIAGRVGLSLPSASRLVGRLVAVGYLQSGPDPADRRAALVQATSLGRRVASSVLDRRRRLIAEVLADVDDLRNELAADVLRLAQALDRLG